MPLFDPQMREGLFVRRTDILSRSQVSSPRTTSHHLPAPKVAITPINRSALGSVPRNVRDDLRAALRTPATLSLIIIRPVLATRVSSSRVNSLYTGRPRQPLVIVMKPAEDRNRDELVADTKP